MNRTIYDLQFDESEKREIVRLRRLDMNRKTYAWISGIATFVGVFLSQSPFHGTDWIHALATYGCIPAGVAAGFYINHQLNQFIENQFKNKWDPLYFQRKGTSPAEEAARDEILRLTDSPRFHGLTEEQQKEEMEKINRKYGL